MFETKDCYFVCPELEEMQFSCPIMDESLFILEKIVSLFVGLTQTLGVSDLQNKFTFSFCQARRIYVLSCPCSANTESVNGGQDPGHVHNFNKLSPNIKKAVLNIAQAVLS